MHHTAKNNTVRARHAAINTNWHYLYNILFDLYLIFMCSPIDACWSLFAVRCVRGPMQYVYCICFVYNKKNNKNNYQLLREHKRGTHIIIMLKWNIWLAIISFAYARAAAAGIHTKINAYNTNKYRYFFTCILYRHTIHIGMNICASTYLLFKWNNKIEWTYYNLSAIYFRDRRTVDWKSMCVVLLVKAIAVAGTPFKYTHSVSLSRQYLWTLVIQYIIYVHICLMRSERLARVLLSRSAYYARYYTPNNVLMVVYMCVWGSSRGIACRVVNASPYYHGV